MSIRHTSHARYDLWYHICWATKYRKKVFLYQYSKDFVKQLLCKIAKEYDMQIGIIEVLSNHVHLTLSAPPRIAPSHAVQILKSVSTKLLFQHYPWLKHKYWGGEIWVTGYFIRTVGPYLTKESIEDYIQKQSEEY
jgi:putative transposase